MRQNMIETVMGAVVLVAAAFFLYFAYSTSEFRAVAGQYELSARFDRIGSIRPGSDVRISGIKVGTVLATTLDPKTYLATVSMSIDPTYKLPTDTVAEVLSAGLLGDEYVALVPGGAEKTIPPGGRILYTQGPVNIGSLIGKYMFTPQAGAGKKGPGGGPSPSPGPAPAGR